MSINAAARGHFLVSNHSPFSFASIRSPHLPVECPADRLTQNLLAESASPLETPSPVMGNANVFRANLDQFLRKYRPARAFALKLADYPYHVWAFGRT